MATNKNHHIPQNGSELTPQWFTEVIGGSLNNAVVSVERSIIGEGIGFIGELHRCVLTWEHDPGDDTPCSVVVKIPSAVDANRALGEAMQAYEREIVAYRDLGQDIGTPMPLLYHAEMDSNPAAWLERPIVFLFRRLPVSGVNWLVLQFIKLSGKKRRRYLMVIEDIDDARPPSQVDGGSLDDALAALEVLARFHAVNWMKELPPEPSRLVWSLDRYPKVFQASYLRNRDDFLEQYGEVIGDEKIARLDAANADLARLSAEISAGPWTLLHGDYRLDNILYRPDGKLVVLDYQLLGKGRPGWDVAYFITTALTAEHRVDEDSLLGRYHGALVEAGVSDYSWDQLLADVETTKLMLAHRMVCGFDVLDTQMGDQDESFTEILAQRVCDWID